MSPYASIFQKLSRPLLPQPTGVSPLLSRQEGIRAVLFDIYGTLIISGSGDVGTTGEVGRAAAAKDAFAAMGLELPSSADDVVAAFLRVIEEHQKIAKERNIIHPEVDIIEVWRNVCPGDPMDGNSRDDTPRDPARLAVEFEARANPVWQMPGLEPCLAALRDREQVLGIISNAQFFTLELFPALIGKTIDDLGFDPHLRYYSYEHRHAKPSEHMYRLAAESLTSRGIEPAEVLYIGNDMRNDMLPAAAVGFRTVLFAGDARSLRLREEDPACAAFQPNAIVTHLSQIVDLI